MSESALPTGIVTFLYTDVEGSTRLWQEHPEVMPVVIARHDALLRQAVELHGGVVFRTMGDAICAAFPIPSDALTAAVDGQLALHAEPWEEGISLRVRMALHSGDADVREGDYVGHTLNRVARLMAAGHGGQILISSTTRDLIRDHLANEMQLVDLGEHRLKDLVLPERIYMVQTPHLPAEFPPLRTLDPPRTNLPARVPVLVGRDREIQTAEELLTRRDVGLVTFTGTGGTGKTTLACAVGRGLLARFPDGVWFVSLAPISDPALVPSAITASLGLREESGKLPIDTLRDFLAPKDLLLILDNLEQVTGAAPLLAALLQHAPHLTILATSRIPLRIREERELPIAPLSLPDGDLVRRTQDLAQSAAVQLFAARAQEVKPSFTLTDDNAAAVAEICIRLDGLPLAIELAAARIRILTPEALLRRLERRLPLLTGGAHDLPARQQTMEAAIAWSYDLLTEEEQVLYRRLSVFAGGFTLEEAEAVCDPDQDGLDLLDGLTSLVEKSLLRQDVRAAEPRFSMLQVIREYGLSRLEDGGEAGRFHREHASYFTDRAEAMERRAYAAGPGTEAATMEAEWDNFRAALDWSLGASGDQPLAVRLVASLGHFLLFSNHAAEGRARTEALFACRGEHERDETWAAALTTLGVLTLQRGDYAQGLAHIEESERILQNSDDLFHRALVLNWLGIVALNMGDAQRAEALFVQNREIARALSFPWGATTALGSIADTLVAQGRLDEAGTTAAEAATAYRDLHDPYGVGKMEAIRATVAWLRGNREIAHRHAAEAVALARQVTEPYNLSRAGTLYGIILMDEGKDEEAEMALTESLFNWRAVGNRGGMTIALAGLTAASARQGHVARARRLYAAEPLCPRDGQVLVDGILDIGFDRFMACIHDTLGDHPVDVPPTSLDVAVDLAMDT